MPDDVSPPQVEYRRLVKTPPLNPFQAIKSGFSKYASFKGRSRRSEFWWFLLLFCLVDGFGLFIDGKRAGIVVVAVLAVVLVPYLAVCVRRLHDTDRSGWLILLSFVPLIGGLLLLVWWGEDSDGDNRFGPYPKWKAP